MSRLLEVPEKLIRETMAFLVAYGAGMGPRDKMVDQAEALHDTWLAFFSEAGGKQ